MQPKTFSARAWAQTLIIGLAVSLVSSGCIWIGWVSTDSGGGDLPSRAEILDVSDDGRYVLFYSGDDYTSTPTNGWNNIYRRDMVAGVNELVSTSTGGAVGDGAAFEAEISHDGRYVAFASGATNMVGNDTNGLDDVFRRDMNTGVTIRVSENPTGVPGATGESRSPSISGNGNVVAYRYVDSSGATPQQVYATNVNVGATVRVSEDASGNAGDGISSRSAVNFVGTVVAFESLSTNFSVDTNGTWDIFVKEILTGAIVRSSTSTAGAQANERSLHPSINDAGTVVAFSSDADNLVPNDANGFRDVFVKVVGGPIFRASIDESGIEGGGRSMYPDLSASGTRVAFMSEASNLTGLPFGEAGGVVRDGVSNRTDLVSVDADGNGVSLDIGNNPHVRISPNGQMVAMSLEDSLNSADGASPADLDVYLIAYPFPEITSMSPATFSPGDVATVTISGSGFEDPVALYGDAGYAWSNVTVVDSTTITATITVDAAASPGPRFASMLVGAQGAGPQSANGDVCEACLTIN